MSLSSDITTSEPRLGILMPGLGAVATTFIAGALAIKHKLAKPIGALTQMGKFPVQNEMGKKNPAISEVFPLVAIKNLAFGGWDIYEDNVYEAAVKAGVLDAQILTLLKEELEAIKPMKAVFDKRYVRNLDGPNVKNSGTKMQLAEALRADIQSFKLEQNCQRLVMIWCGSTEAYIMESDVHKSIEAFEEGLRNDDPYITPSMIYAYAALKERVPFANGSPNLCVDIPALEALAILQQTPIAGKDFKTGQTLIKTIVAPGLKARNLGIHGWFSTNILGNRDGLVLDDKDSFKTKEQSKLSVLEQILDPENSPDLYKDLVHVVRINYYPPRGDEKEAWDNIDIFGWMGYKMQIKINFLCRDSILAAPIVLDLALFLDLAHQTGWSGVQEWLSFYFKSPQSANDVLMPQDVFVQETKLFAALTKIKEMGMVSSR